MKKILLPLILLSTMACNNNPATEQDAPKADSIANLVTEKPYLRKTSLEQKELHGQIKTIYSTFCSDVFVNDKGEWIAKDTNQQPKVQQYNKDGMITVDGDINSTLMPGTTYTYHDSGYVLSAYLGNKLLQRMYAIRHNDYKATYRQYEYKNKDSVLSSVIVSQYDINGHGSKAHYYDYKNDRIVDSMIKTHDYRISGDSNISTYTTGKNVNTITTVDLAKDAQGNPTKKLLILSENPDKPSLILLRYEYYSVQRD